MFVRCVFFLKSMSLVCRSCVSVWDVGWYSDFFGIGNCFLNVLCILIFGRWSISISLRVMI